MIAKTINEVIEHLELIIQASKDEQSTLGYFAALYQKVTITIKDKLGTGYFDDDKRMEKLDVVFANRYLAAYSDYRQGKNITAAWKYAFDSSTNKNLIVLQHLILGMNAHINLDLGIAAAEISDTSTINNLHSDFDKINEILASLVDEIQHDLAKIWPTLLVILKAVKKVDNFLVDFSMNLARNGAWKFANEMVVQKEQGSMDELVSKRDVKIAQLAKKITSHGIMVKILFMIIRFSERGKPADKIVALEKVME